MAALTTSAKLTLTNMRAMVFGPPGLGKTWASLTMSEFCPAEFTHVERKYSPTDASPKPLIALKDMLWISFDEGATDGFAQGGYDVPQINMANMRMEDYDKEINELHATVTREVSAKRTKTLVVDTVSKLSHQLHFKAYHLQGLRNFDVWGAIANDHKKFAMPLKALNVNILWLCHAKAQNDVDAATVVGANTQRTRQAAGTAAIIPDIPGSSLNQYRGDSSFVFSVVKDKVPDGWTHHFYTLHRDYEGKSRLKLPEKMPADWREVRKVVLAAQAAQPAAAA